MQACPTVALLTFACVDPMWRRAIHVLEALTGKSRASCIRCTIAPKRRKRKYLPSDVLNEYAASLEGSQFRGSVLYVQASQRSSPDHRKRDLRNVQVRLQEWGAQKKIPLVLTDADLHFEFHVLPVVTVGGAAFLFMFSMVTILLTYLKGDLAIANPFCLTRSRPKE